MASRPKKNFVLLDSQNNDTPHVFASAQPRGAALKGCSRGNTRAHRLRERGTNRVHVFTGSVSEVDALQIAQAGFPQRSRRPM